MLEKEPSLPISRAQMRLLIHTALADASKVLPAITPLLSAVESERKEAGELEMTVLVYPGAFREITEAVARLTRGKGTVHTLNLKVLQEAEDTDDFQ